MILKIKFSQKKSKFGIEKYNVENKHIKKINLKIVLLIRYKTNSCRYDWFLTLFSIVIDHKYLNNSIESNNKLINTCKSLLRDPDTNLRFVFWKYLTDTKIDINNSIFKEDKYKKFGFISQLFSIINDNKNFVY